MWGARGIVFDKETLGRRGGVPGYQLYLLSGGRVTQITHIKVYWLNEGLVPAAVSADGTRLAANLLGEAGNAPQAWSVNLVTHAVHNLGTWLVAHGISRDGQRVPLDEFQIPFWPANKQDRNDPIHRRPTHHPRPARRRTQLEPVPTPPSPATTPAGSGARAETASMRRADRTPPTRLHRLRKRQLRRRSTRPPQRTRGGSPP